MAELAKLLYGLLVGHLDTILAESVWFSVFPALTVLFLTSEMIALKVLTVKLVALVVGLL